MIARRYQDMMGSLNFGSAGHGGIDESGTFDDELFNQPFIPDNPDALSSKATRRLR